jgi:hypothetical protein
MVLTLSDEEVQQLRAALLDDDGKEAIRLLKQFLKRLDQQKRSGVKPPLG